MKDFEPDGSSCETAAAHERMVCKSEARDARTVPRLKGRTLMDVSSWAWQRFGPAAYELVQVVPAALAEAHASAVDAQVSSRTQKKDPYGHTLKNTQHERLVEAGAALAGVEVFHPHGASFELLRFPATSVVLYPWRYATNSAQSRQNARMRSSAFRKELLTGAAAGPRQLTLEESVEGSAEDLDVQLAEEVAVLEELRSTARVVTIGYASNPQALFALGWGDADLVDDRGTVVWRHWEDLALLGQARGGAAGTGTRGPGPRPPLRPVDSGSALPPAPRAPRFDDAPLADDEFGITARGPLAGEPSQDPQPPSRDTGTGKPTGDDQS